MKYHTNIFPLLFLIFTLNSCTHVEPIDKSKQTQNVSWTEAQKWKYFQDSIAHRMYNGRYGLKVKDSLNDFDVFARVMFVDIKAKNKKDPFIYAFEEPFIDTTMIDSNEFWFRISVDPCFRRPYCLIVEKKYNKTYLTAKMTDGEGGYLSGLLDFSITEVFSDSSYNEISRQLDSLNFWTLKEDKVCTGGFDGEEWTFERIEKGKYNIISRWCPTDCGNKTTKLLGKLGIQIRDKSKMLDILALKLGLDRKKEYFTSY